MFDAHGGVFEGEGGDGRALCSCGVQGSLHSYEGAWLTHNSLSFEGHLLHGDRIYCGGTLEDLVGDGNYGPRPFPLRKYGYMLNTLQLALKPRTTHGWTLSDLVGARLCNSGGTLSSPKESNIPGFGLHEEHSCFAELDFLEEHELSPSQEESVALGPQMPSPPTHSGLGASRAPGKLTFSAANEPWEFDYLFIGPDHTSMISVLFWMSSVTCSPSITVSRQCKQEVQVLAKWCEYMNRFLLVVEADGGPYRCSCLNSPRHFSNMVMNF
ncbi:hypothetical protein GOP47_0025837 [Adiantum capillus-veneris]|uniref:Uncharacterized protein n=1 Tax=Adiantum capillus-veneris TaxID=13818 RepID=A0A9D4U181_ADICA|nr:hypothetical protein GOP47_0025837 [Adiantum capillus-veneris]